MALGVPGLGCEDALTHLLNYVWPNIFEESPHLINGVMGAIDGCRLSLGPCIVLHYTLQVSVVGVSTSSVTWGTQVQHTAVWRLLSWWGALLIALELGLLQHSRHFCKQVVCLVDPTIPAAVAPEAAAGHCWY
jgi:hypothetical protein